MAIFSQNMDPTSVDNLYAGPLIGDKEGNIKKEVGKIGKGSYWRRKKRLCYRSHGRRSGCLAAVVD